MAADERGFTLIGGRPVVSFFSGLAAVGLALSVLSHLATFFGKQGPLGDYAFVLHVGVFVVWLPTVFASSGLTSGFQRKDFWKASLRGCPPWMRYMVYGFLGYAVLNFVIFMANAPPKGGSGPMPAAVVRGFSGHWMAFYSVAMATLYSAAHVKDRDAARRCLQGHAVGPLAQFCEQCGQPAVEGSSGGKG
jgi:hypothetical protein